MKNMRGFMHAVCAVILVAALAAVPGCGKKTELILATTTSTQDSGLLDVLLPEFQKKTGIMVKTIAVGSGQAMAMGERGEADVLLVHSPDAEKKFMEGGFGSSYKLVMHNDFIMVGPADDPAKLKGEKSSIEAFKKLAASGAMFMSRGDKSGTHSKELKLWKDAKIDPEKQKWYQSTSLGMGDTLKVASEKKAYTLADRGTYLALKKNLGLEILVEGDEALKNIYHVISINAGKFPKVNKDGAEKFVDFIVSKEVQETIGKFGVDKYGSPLFFPDALKK